MVREKTSAAATELTCAELIEVGESPASLRKELTSTKPDIVFHLASLFIAEHRESDVRPLCDSNIAFGALLLDAMVATNCTKFISAGTSWQDFEDCKGNPACLYAATKEAFEAIIRYFVDAHGLDAMVLRIFDSYGPGDRRRKLLSILREAAESSQPISLSPGWQRIDLVHVHDICDAFICGAEMLLDPHQTKMGLQTYNLSSGNSVTIRELVQIYQEVSNKKIHAEWGKRPYRAREVMTPSMVGTTLPGWRPKIDLHAGLKEFAFEIQNV